MITEITDIKNANGWVLFDAECRLCARLASRVGPLLGRYRFELIPLQTPWVRERLGLTDEQLLSELRLLTPQGALYGGADALLALARQIWWARPIDRLCRLVAAEPVLRAAYRWVAEHRNGCGRGCALRISPPRPRNQRPDWLLALLPSAAVLLARPYLPAWVWMWAAALTLFFGAKWLTVSRFLSNGGKAPLARLLAYLFFWPGMDLRAFCRDCSCSSPPAREWLFAGAKSLLGAALVWGGVRRVGASFPLMRGWLGMLGVVLLLHFGVFHLLSLVWRARGIDAKPLMRSPAVATSLGEFWGGRWNTAFRDLMHEQFFKPMAARLGGRQALAAVFLLSGLLHEFVLSVPARGGYGLPTLYFALQGGGLFFERAALGRGIGLGCGWKGWGFVVLVAGLPAFWLFSPTFIRNVILPMLRAIGAT